MGAATMENSMEVPQGTIEEPNDPAMLLLGIYLDKAINKKDTYTPMFIAALFITAKTWKQPKCSLTNKWIKKIRYMHTRTHTYTHTHTHTHAHTHTHTHTDNGILLSHKKEIMLLAATCTDLDIIILGEVRKRKTNVISLIHVI